MTRIVLDDVLFERRDCALEDTVRLVTRTARESCGGDCRPLSASLDACVEQVVTRLWQGRIRTFVPLLALRAVRECIRAGRCPSPNSGA